MREWKKTYTLFFKAYKLPHTSFQVISQPWKCKLMLTINLGISVFSNRAQMIDCLLVFFLRLTFHGQEDVIRHQSIETHSLSHGCRTFINGKKYIILLFKKGVWSLVFERRINLNERRIKSLWFSFSHKDITHKSSISWSRVCIFKIRVLVFKSRVQD